ncbi:hypothetical protein ACLB2K_063828 [Fragaria x ananassa]
MWWWWWWWTDGVGAAHALVGVNKPELLPKEFSPVIDVAGFLSDGQEKRLAQEIANIEKDTGFKLRVLAQNYPDTPGLAIKDFWQVDDRTIVFVADPTFGNILNFNVGALVDLDVPRSFWSRLAGKYGNMFYWKEKGEDVSIEAAVTAISSCLREPVGSDNCSEKPWMTRTEMLFQIVNWLMGWQHDDAMANHRGKIIRGFVDAWLQAPAV